jgi:putative ABC transport system permease protein
VRLWRLALGNLRRDLGGAVLLALTVAAGVGMLTFFVALGRGVTTDLHRLFPEAERRMEVVPPRVQLGGLFGVRLDDQALARLRTLSGVAGAEREMALRVPASSVYRGRFFGADLNMGIEVAVLGVERAFVAQDLPAGEAFEWPGSGPVPACVSDRLLAIYDTTFAPTRGLPYLTASAVVGFTLPVTVGRSLVASSGPGPEVVVSARIACVSPRALLAGLTLPLSAVRSWNRQAGVDAESYSAVALTAAAEDEVPALEEEVRRMGFAIDDSERRGASVAGKAAAIFTLVLGLLSLLITALAATGISQSLTLSVRSRRREIGLLRALGATPGDAAALVLWEAATLGLLGGLVGLIGALGAARLADQVALGLLPQFPGRPETLFALRPGLAIAALGLALVAALAGALAPARLAARLDPARSLQQG